MKERDRANTLLLEILIALLFFAIASAAIVKVFAGAWELTGRTERRAALLAEAQETAERLYAADDAEVLLTERGFAQNKASGMWERGENNALLQVKVAFSEGATGTMRLCSVTGTELNGAQRTEKLFELPIDRFFPKEAP